VSDGGLTRAILPGATIGIFGGGQLGRLTAMAARGMGYRILVLDPDPACPARFVVDGCIEAGWDDSREAANLARGCDVVTLEIEQISPASMDAAASYAPVRPGGAMLAIIQNRIEQKDWLRRNGFPVGEYRAVRSLDELRDAVAALGGRCFCKSATGGYDGRGQGKVGFADGAVVEDEVRNAWTSLGERAGVAENAVELEREISVLVARAPNGEVKVYPAAWNHHEDQILAWSVMPAPLSSATAAEAREIAEAIADTFQLEGVLAVEMFLTSAGKLLVNELAPPHPMSSDQVFEIVLEVGHELAGIGAVDDAVVEAEGEALDAADGDGVLAVLIGEDDGFFVQAADAEDGRLRLGDDGRAELLAEDAGVGEGEGAAGDIVRRELLCCARGRPDQRCPRDAEEGFFFRLLDDGDDEAPLQRDRDADVDVLVVEDGIALGGGVDDGMLAQRGHMRRA
jgi:5-(carboxyamino)imidazole ribonucleotide synthase